MLLLTHLGHRAVVHYAPVAIIIVATGDLTNF